VARDLEPLQEGRDARRAEARIAPLRLLEPSLVNHLALMLDLLGLRGDLPLKLLHLCPHLGELVTHVIGDSPWRSDQQHARRQGEHVYDCLHRFSSVFPVTDCASGGRPRGRGARDSLAAPLTRSRRHVHSNLCRGCNN
jgi:hypothetical protein